MDGGSGVLLLHLCPAVFVEKQQCSGLTQLSTPPQVTDSVIHESLQL